MNLRKSFSTFILTLVFVCVLALGAKAAAANVTYKVSPAAGSMVKPGDTIGVTSTLPGDLGFKEASITLKDENGNVLRKNTNNITDKNVGNNPVYSNALVPTDCKATKIIAVVEGKDTKGDSHTKEFTFVGPGDPKDPQNPNPGNKLTITADKPSGSVIEAGSIVVFTSTSSNIYVGTRKIVVRLYNDDTNVLLETKTAESTYANGANPFNYKKTMPNEPGRYRVEVTATDINGVIGEGIFYYTIVGAKPAEDPTEPEDETYYEGIINPDLEGLVIDLWLRKDTRFYELEEDEIPFVAYYYNAEKKAAKNVTIEVEIPDGFKVVAKSTPYGSVKVKNDTIVYTIGTVPSKEVRPVYFTLLAEDDDVCEQATNVVAVILQDDDEEDQSTQRVWIYEEGGKGSFSAYVTGYPDTTFRADNSITREEVAAIMARAFNHSRINTTKSFSDVKRTGWAYNYIMACATEGIVNGYSNGTFRPYGNITRAELYAMTYRAMYIPEDEKALFVPKKYKNLDSWEKNYIAGLTRLKMLKDMKDTDADEQASRAEVVYLVNGVQFRNPSKMMDVNYSDLTKSHWCSKHIAAASVNYSYKRGEDGKEIVTTK